MQQIVPLITREIAFRWNVCELVFGSDVFYLNLGVQIDSVELPVQSNSVGAGHVSHRRASAFDDHLYHKQCDPTLVYSWVCFGVLHRFPVRSLGFVLVFRESFSALRWLNPTSGAQVNHPYANQHPAIWSLILWSCEILTFASCTSNWSVQMFDVQKCTKLRLMLILSLQDLLQNLNLKITPIDNVMLSRIAHMTIVDGNHLCNECRKLIVPIVCHMLESILWQIVPVCWLTTECRVDQFVPGTNMFIHIWEQTYDNSHLFSNSSF